MDGDQHSRPWHNACINRFPQTDIKEVAASNVSNRRESGHQCLACVLGGSNRLLRDSPLQITKLRALVVGVEIECQVTVRVDETRSYRAILQIHNDHSRSS